MSALSPVHLPPFSTAALVDLMVEHGCVFSLKDDGQPRVKFSVTCPASPALLEELRQRKAEIISILLEEASR